MLLLVLGWLVSWSRRRQQAGKCPCKAPKCQGRSSPAFFFVRLLIFRKKAYFLFSNVAIFCVGDDQLGFHLFHRPEITCSSHPP